jgi:prepilin-type N-terminal cleavage/methylation domain-containing protein
MIECDVAGAIVVAKNVRTAARNIVAMGGLSGRACMFNSRVETEMKPHTMGLGQERGAGARSCSLRNAGSKEAGLTLMEVMVVMALMTILMVGTFSGILSMKLGASRLADFTAMMAVAEARVEDIRVATYNPPNYPFGSSTLYLTNNRSIALDRSGATFFVPGQIVSKIELVPAGHLVTVTATFQTPGKAISTTLQTVVNKFSGGQQ